MTRRNRKSRWPVAVALALAAAVTAGASQHDHDHDAELTSAKLRIGWDEFKKAHASGTVTVVDVRSQAEYEAGHIPGALSIPLESVAKRAAALRKLKKPIVLYCA